MSSMDDMMNMSFDQLRGEVAPAATVSGGSMLAGSMVAGSRGAPMIMGATAPALLMGGSAMSRRVEVPDHPMELRVLFHGPDAQQSAASSSGSVRAIDVQMATAACQGKRDFILFEPLDDAVKQKRRIVLVLPLSAGQGDIKQAQAYLASSLASWLQEQKTDGSGRPYGECKDEDPTLRKHFTRAQIFAIRAFGERDQ